VYRTVYVADVGLHVLVILNVQSRL